MKDVVVNRKLEPMEIRSGSVGQSLNIFASVTKYNAYKFIGYITQQSLPMDFLPTTVQKRCRRVFAPFVAHLVSILFTEGRFPGRFKCAHITPLQMHTTPLTTGLSQILIQFLKLLNT